MTILGKGLYKCLSLLSCMVPPSRTEIDSKQTIADYMVATDAETSSWISPLGVEESLQYLAELPDTYLEHHEGTNYRIADVGCGGGELTERVAEEYPEAEIVSLDLSDESVRQTQERTEEYGNVEVVQGDVLDLLPDMDGFDFIYSINMVQDAPDPGAVMQTFYNSLLDGGASAVTLPTPEGAELFADYKKYDDELDLPYIEKEGIELGGEEADFKQYVFPEQRALEMFEEAGFTTEEIGSLPADASGMKRTLDAFLGCIDKIKLLPKFIAKKVAEPRSEPSVNLYVLET